MGEKPVILPAAVIGLFPLANQGLLRDTQAMISAGDRVAGPVESFIRLGVNLDAPVENGLAAPPAALSPAKSGTAVISQERFVTGSDPCQGRGGSPGAGMPQSGRSRTSRHR